MFRIHACRANRPMVPAVDLFPVTAHSAAALQLLTMVCVVGLEASRPSSSRPPEHCRRTLYCESDRACCGNGNLKLNDGRIVGPAEERPKPSQASVQAVRPNLMGLLAIILLAGVDDHVVAAEAHILESEEGWCICLTG